MSGSGMIDGLMVVFTLVTLGALAAPLLLLPKWMKGLQQRRIDYLRGAIAAVTAELGRPQFDPAHVERLARQRRLDSATLLALAPGERIEPLAAPDPVAQAA